MEDFIRNKNIEEFEKRLAATTDAAERSVLLKLLAEERAKIQVAHPRRQEKDC